MKLVFILGLGVLLAACSSQKSSKNLNDTGTAPEQLGGAITAPLNDLNIIHTEIPKILRDAQKNPYTLPTEQTCPALASQIKSLDEVLGVDLDTPASPKNPGLVERSVDTISDASVSALKRTTEAVVPFRNWVRKLSGAERNSKAVASAIAAGGIRRAYLKGIGQARHCEPPAAPHEIILKGDTKK